VVGNVVVTTPRWLDFTEGVNNRNDLAVDLNQYVNAEDIVAIEVYARGANMPASLQVLDAACGVIAIWTGARR
jgi:hypothetical protein